jgi:hypothetical protein
MLPSNLAPTPAIPTLGYRQPVRHGQVHHATAVLTAALHSPLVHRLIDGRLCVLRFIAPTGQRFTNRTVDYAQTTDGDLVVLVASADDEAWWRTFTMPHPVDVLLHRQWHHALGRAVARGQYGWRRAQLAYAAHFPSVTPDDADIFVVVTLQPAATGPH